MILVNRGDTGRPLTVVVVDGRFHKAGLRRGNPQRKAVLLEAEAEQFLGPVSHLQGFSGLTAA